MEVRYAFQRIDMLPAGFAVPKDRTKPWGTAHAVLSAKELVTGPFAVINADDFYGASAFSSIYNFLKNEADDYHHAMVGYRLENTLTEHGYVARGVCDIDGQCRLTGIVEHTRIEARPGGAVCNGNENAFLTGDTVVSMNLWGFGASMMQEIELRFSKFLEENLFHNPLSCEYFLPTVANSLLTASDIEIKVLPTAESWYGVTYAADMPYVKAAISRLKFEGKYPDVLW